MDTKINEKPTAKSLVVSIVTDQSNRSIVSEENSKQESKFENKIAGNKTKSITDNFPDRSEEVPDSFMTDHHTPFIRDSVKALPFGKRVTHTFREGSSLSTIVTLVMTACVGPGVLSLAYAVAASGWALSVGSMLFCAVLANFSLKLITKVGKVTQKHTYSAIAEQLFKGKKFAMFVRVCFILNSFGEATADLILINELISRCLRNFDISGMPSFLSDPDTHFWQIMFGVFIGFPLCLKKSYKELRVILFSGFVLICYVIFTIFRDSVASDFSTKFHEAKLFRPMGLFITLPITFFSFGCHPVVLDGYKELQVPSEKKFRAVLKKSTVLLLFIYATIGCFGYFHFANAEYKLEAGNLLLAYDPDDITVDVAMLFFSFTLCFSLPLCMKPVKNMLTEIVLHKGQKETEKQHVILTAITVGSVILASSLISNITIIVNFLGASVNAMIVFNLPCTFYIMLCNQKGRKKTPIYYMAILVNIALFLFSMFSLGYLIYRIVKGESVVG